MADIVPLEAVLRDADPSGLLQETDIQTLASAVRRAMDSWTLTFPGRTCPACGKRIGAVTAKSQRALVLDVDGLHDAQHIPSRCRRKNCPRKGCYVWHNFTVIDKTRRDWTLINKQSLPSIIMTSQKFGITRRRYVQYSRRLAVHFSSFWGEAKIHWTERWGRKLSFNRLKLRLQDAWFNTRMLVRIMQLPTKPSGCWAVSDDLEKSVERLRAVCDDFMQCRRQEQARGAGDITGIVLDGHIKAGRRRRCGVPLIHGLSRHGA